MPRGVATPTRRNIARGLALGILVFPWLWPYTSGPSPNALPLMVSWACLSVLLPALATDTVSRSDWPNLVASGWLVAALASCTLALGQWFDALPVWSFLATAPTGRAYANLRQPNQFASLTSLGLLGLLWLAGRKPATWHWAALVLLAAGNAASASRTGLVQWLLIAALMAWWPAHRAARLRVCVAALATYAFLAVLLPMLLYHFRGIELYSLHLRMGQELGCSSRKVLWSNVVELIAQRPWTGWGWGELDYAHYVHLYAGPRFCDILDNGHSLPLHVAVELGIPAALLMTAAVLAAIWKARPWAQADPARQIAWAALVVIGVHSLVEYPLWYGPFQLALAATFVLLVDCGSLSVRARGVGSALGLALLVALAIVYVSYDRVSELYRPSELRRASMRVDPLAVVGDPPLFRAQVRFAELSITPLSAANAGRVHELATQLIHFSPEPSVIEKLIESAALLDRTEEAEAHAARYRAAFPEHYRKWALAQRRAPLR